MVDEMDDLLVSFLQQSIPFTVANLKDIMFERIKH